MALTRRERELMKVNVSMMKMAAEENQTESKDMYPDINSTLKCNRRFILFLLENKILVDYRYIE